MPSAFRNHALIASSALAVAFALSGATVRSDEATEPSLHALPVNSRAVLKEFSTADHAMHPLAKASSDYLLAENPGELWPQKAFAEQPPLCREFDAGCPIIEYFDNEALTDFSFLVPDAKGDPLSSEGSQFFLSHYISRFLPNNNSCVIGTHKNFGDWFNDLGINGYNTSTPTKKNCRALALPALSLPDQIRAKATQAIQMARESLESRGVVSPEAEAAVLGNPLSFKDLPAMYRDVLGKPRAQESVEKLIHKALWITVEALTNSAYSSLPTFPYLERNTVTSDKLMTADYAVEKVRKWRGELPLVGLNEEVRKRLSESCKEFPKSNDDLQKPCRGFLRRNASGNWKTLAAFSPNENLIYVDYTNDFYEAVYALQHELWHAMIENTAQSDRYRRRIEGLVGLPVDDNSTHALKETLIYMTIQNELDAISESNLLYRYAGHLTHQWGALTPSAKGWFDSEYADDSAKSLYIPFSRRLDWMGLRPGAAQAETEKQLMSAWWYKGSIDNSGWAGWMATGTFGISGLFLEIYADHKRTKAESQDRINLEKLKETKLDLDETRKAFSEKFAQDDIPPSVLEFFGEKYEFDLPDYQEFEQPKDLLKLEFVHPDPVHLTCEQAERIASLMPEEWEHGIPLYFVAVNSDGSPCAQGPGHVPGVGGGTHGDISALPCVGGEK